MSRVNTILGKRRKGGLQSEGIKIKDTAARAIRDDQPIQLFVLEEAEQHLQLEHS